MITNKPLIRPPYVIPMAEGGILLDAIKEVSVLSDVLGELSSALNRRQDLDSAQLTRLSLSVEVRGGPDFLGAQLPAYKMAQLTTAINRFQREARDLITISNGVFDV